MDHGDFVLILDFAPRSRFVWIFGERVKVAHFVELSV